MKLLAKNYPQFINVVSSKTKRNILDYNFLNNMGLMEYLMSEGAEIDPTSDVFMEALLVRMERNR